MLLSYHTLFFCHRKMMQKRTLEDAFIESVPRKNNNAGILWPARIPASLFPYKAAQ